MLREQLINTIARCGDKNQRKKWIIELSQIEGIECSESQCYSCPIQSECIPVMHCMACIDYNSFFVGDECSMCTNKEEGGLMVCQI